MKSGGTPAGPRKSMIVKRIVSFPESEMVSGMIIASAISKLFLHLWFWQIMLDKSQEQALQSPVASA
jgi:hypothetical protein